MKRIIASRGTGKSTELLKMAMREKHGAIAVPYRSSINHYIAIAHDIGVAPSEIQQTPEYAIIAGVTVAPFDMFIERPKTSDFSPYKKVFVDELERCVKGLLLRHDFEGYTISLEEAGDFR